MTDGERRGDPKYRSVARHRAAAPRKNGQRQEFVLLCSPVQDCQYYAEKGQLLNMRDQYAGDVSDVIKFAFLRALAGKDRTLGIAWYYAPGHDGRSDGRHLEWREETAWRALDEELHSGLATLPERSVAALEQAIIWPEGALFHREPVPCRGERHAWGMRKRSALDGADIPLRANDCETRAAE